MEINNNYKYGFTTDIEQVEFPKGLSTEVIKMISAKNNEPDWLLNFRLEAYEYWKTLSHPNWQYFKLPEINFNDVYYYAAPKQEKKEINNLDELDPELLETFKKLGIPLKEQERLMGVAVDVVFDSVSLGTTHQED